MKIKHLIFDVDGTLWDAAEAVAESWTICLQQAPETAGLRVTQDDMYRYMGLTMEEIGLRVLPELTPVQRTAVMERCMAFENDYLLTHSGHFYPKVRETLTSLWAAGYRLYIVSNCQGGYIETMLHCGDIPYAAGHDLDNDGRRDSGVGVNTFGIADLECFGYTREGKAKNIARIMARHGMTAEDTLYVGDTEMDEAACDEAGVRMVHAQYGFGTAKHPLAELSSFATLPGLLGELEEQ